MQAVIFEQSPLAQYLEGAHQPPFLSFFLFTRATGNGERDHAWASSEVTDEAGSQPSFAPPLMLPQRVRARKSPPQLWGLTNKPFHQRLLAQMWEFCSVRFSNSTDQRSYSLPASRMRLIIISGRPTPNYSSSNFATPSWLLSS